MKLLVIAVGRRMPQWIQDGFAEYARRMPREALLRLVELKPSPRGRDDSSAARARFRIDDARRIDAAVPPGAVRVALDERGESWNTRELARHLSRWKAEGHDVAFLIGGPDGLAPELKREARFVWSLSALTLPHGMVRVIVAEQLYRAQSILLNHPYHRD